ncbi:lasso RiPP family leader peptide-containing protein [Halalkaliarchaeum sp. AArc-CO]|nr:lasso RiPP family leader peptide-containing protein [Halalkaliarchaeum sp. AArc-CO]
MKDYQPPKVETHGKVEELTQDEHYGHDEEY